MKSLRDLWRELSLELGSWCHTSTARDLKTVTSRIEKEGESFLTITLPSFCSDFEKCLDQGFVDSNSFYGFRRRNGLPAFLSGFLCQIFDLRSGELLRDPDIDCIFAIRQLTRLFKKIEMPCSDARVSRAMFGYLNCEQEVERWDSTVSETLLTEFSEMSRLLFADVFSRMDQKVYDGDITPRHGSGATADGLRGNAKFHLQHWPDRLEEVFPYGEYAIPNWRYYYLLNDVQFLEPGSEIPVKVIPVPKTLKTPRIIAEEPAHMQYMQQAILRPLVRELESYSSLVHGLIGFSDQEPNRALARQASFDGTLATLDLKEASDRVSNRLVEALFQGYPWIGAAVQATRSTRATISSIGVSIPNLKKFASMGSATCFPVEAMVFLTTVCIGIQRQANSPLRARDIRSLAGKVRVYGDDIIIPTDCVEYVTQALHDFGCVVNSGKSFWNGKFRESCGGDYYGGQDVRPVYLTQPFPLSRSDVSSLASTVAFRNQLYFLGLWKTAAALDEDLVNLLGGHFPIVESTSALLGRNSFLPYLYDRMDSETHSPLVRGWAIRPRIPKSNLGEEWALVKCLLSSEPFEDERHLERAGRPSALDIKLKWMTPY